MVRRAPPNPLDEQARSVTLAFLDRAPLGAPEQVTAAVRKALLHDSPNLRRGDFDRISTVDLEVLFELYDQHAFGRCLADALSGTQPRLRMSRRMTRSAGLTTIRRGQVRTHAGVAPWRWFDVAISVPLVLGAFRDDPRPVHVAGRLCHDRLDVLQRVFEHELLHVFESLCTGRSSCSGAAFRKLAWDLFAHTESRHEMISPTQRRWIDSGIRPGDAVRFSFEGHTRVGRVNGIRQRATVLVRSLRGRLYDDGVRYAKYYVPLSHLTRVDDHRQAPADSDR